jgi:hypothetical protein
VRGGTELSRCRLGFGPFAHLFQSLSYPELNNGLPRDSQALRCLIEGVDHPYRKIDVHALLLVLNSPGFGEVEMLGDVSPLID